MPLDNSAEYANHIPEAIRRQAMKADEIAREIGMAGLEPVEEPAPIEEPAPEPVVEEPVPTPAPVPAAEPAPDLGAVQFAARQIRHRDPLAAQRGR